MSNHTPGPWTKCGTKVMHGPGGTLYLCQCDIVEKETDVKAPLEEAFANARLIAAVPDLLALATQTHELCYELLGLANYISLDEGTRAMIASLVDLHNETLKKAGYVE